MSVYVGIDVHSKRSQVAVVTGRREGAAEPERREWGGVGLEADRWAAGGDAGQRPRSIF